MRKVNKWIRQIHRWLVVPFLVAIIYLIFESLLSSTTAELPVWFSSVAVCLLFALLLTGIYLFALHYNAKWRRINRAR